MLVTRWGWADTVEFLKMLLNELKGILTDRHNEALDKGKLSYAQRNVINTLLPEGGDTS